MRHVFFLQQILSAAVGISLQNPQEHHDGTGTD
jgi:hypothetical protein